MRIQLYFSVVFHGFVRTALNMNVGFGSSYFQGNLMCINAWLLAI